MTMKFLPTVVASLFLTSALPVFAQQPAPPAVPGASSAKADMDVTHGRIKEMTANQKVVIDVDDAVDKEYDLTDKDLTVKVAKGLKVGDPVQVTEREVKGKKTVDIALHTDPGVKHGDRSRSGEKAK